jgi:hypothetical protein
MALLWSILSLSSVRKSINQRVQFAMICLTQLNNTIHKDYVRRLVEQILLRQGLRSFKVGIKGVSVSGAEWSHQHTSKGLGLLVLLSLPPRHNFGEALLLLLLLHLLWVLSSSSSSFVVSYSWVFSSSCCWLLCHQCGKQSIRKSEG